MHNLDTILKILTFNTSAVLLKPIISKITVSLFILSHKKSCKSLNPGHPDSDKSSYNSE
jgi:hypothetical protein